MPARAEIINSILIKDRDQFNAWIANPENKLNLEIPEHPLRYFITPRIYDFAKNPEKVKAVTNVCKRNIIHFFILEERDEPLSDLVSLVLYQAKRSEFGAWQPSVGILGLPGKLDYYHAEWPDEVEGGLIKLSDFVFNDIYLVSYPHGELQVVGYGDRPELRRKGIGLGFYQRLREFALRSGYRFITGEVDYKNDQNSNYLFYTKKLGRKRLDKLPKHLRELFRDSHHDDFQQVFTVECLYPEDLIG